MAINEREQRGLAIAALCKLNGKNGVWAVPSQSGSGKYEVIHDGTMPPRCTCPDFETRACKCKHIYAVEYTIQREVNKDGSTTLTETMTVTKKVTYKQDWPAYNMAQATEKKRLQVLLADLLRNVQEPERPTNKRGRKPHLLKDAIFAAALKVYCGLSARRFSCDLLDAHEAGYTTVPIPGAKVTKFFEDPRLTPILHQLIAKSAAPLKVVETDFAVDSTGFSTSRFEKWFDFKYGTTRQQAVWVKVHAAVGVKTNVITAVRILDKDSGDSPQFKPLVQKTAETFTVREVSADKAYGSNENFGAVDELGGTAFIAFKANATGACGGLFEKMFGYFQFQREEFLAHYHKRSNVESTFSAVKRKFGDSVMSRTDTAMVNETLCKLLCHNLTCLIQEQETLGIVPIFWKDDSNKSVRLIEGVPSV